MKEKGLQVETENKKVKNGAEGETRTLTLLPERDFESRASTSSTTSAHDLWIATMQYFAPERKLL